MKVKSKHVSKDELDEIQDFMDKKSKKDMSRNPINDFINSYSAREFTCKSQNQKKIIQSICNNDTVITVVHGKAGTGKAQPLDSKILTPNGWTIMGEIKEGDDVIGVDGKPTKVTGVYPQGYKDIYEVTFSDGSKTKCCLDHLWYTETYYDRNYVKKNKGKTIYSPRAGSVKPLSEIKDNLVVNGKKNHTIPMVNPVEFIDKKLIVDPYIMGVILGDGNITTRRIVISTADKEIIDNLELVFCDTIKIEKVNSSKYEYTIKAKVKGPGQNAYLNELIDINLIGKDCYTKVIPEKYLYNSITNRISLLQGLMDTDGYVDKRNGSCYFYTTSYELSQNVIELVNSLGGVVSVKTKNKKYKYLGEIKTGKTSYVLCISLPPNINPFRLSRKRELVIPKTKYTPKRYITNIELVGNELAQCISVEDERHLYVTDDFIVTHNTFSAIQGTLKQFKSASKTNEPYNKIYLLKSVKTLDNKSEDIGFLKGTMEDKIAPFMFSYDFNFTQIVDRAAYNMAIETQLIEFLPLAYIRGIGLSDCIIILDEAQNVNNSILRTVLSRIGKNCKLIILGDTKQKDSSNTQTSGLDLLITHFKDIKGIDFIEMGPEDQSRASIINTIEDRYDDLEKDGVNIN